jgi:hypothetical protein
VLTVTKGKKDTRYAVTEVYVSPNYGAGRAFQLFKADGTVYHLFLADDRPHSTCDCPGCSYQNAEKADARHGDRFETLGCCHLDAVHNVIWNNWLPDPRTNPGADVGATETDEQEESLASAEAAAFDAMCEAADQRAAEALWYKAEGVEVERADPPF